MMPTSKVAGVRKEVGPGDVPSFGYLAPAKARRPDCLGQSHSSVQTYGPPAGCGRARRDQVRPCTCLRSGLQACSSPASSDPVDLRHPKQTTYGCSLPGLTRFAAPRRAGPDRQRRLTRTVPREPALRQGFNPAIADCGYRAPLPPRLARSQRRRRDSNPRWADAHTRFPSALLKPLGHSSSRALGGQYPRQGSNLRLRFRRPALYPLSYGGTTERVGFEPTVDGVHTAFREQHHQPLGHLSRRCAV